MPLDTNQYNTLMKSQSESENEETVKRAFSKTPQEMFDIGRAYYSEGDYQKALYYLEKAANQGDAEAQNNLGIMYENGEGVTKNHKKAVYLYEQAAHQGDIAAQYNLGRMYYDGGGVTKDYVEAYRWLILVKAKSNEEYKDINKILDSLEKLISPSQITKAQKLASLPAKAFYHPWRRFFARTYDWLFSHIILLPLLPLFVYSFPQVFVDFPMIIAILFPFILWLPVEAAFIATTGTTPTKWIFGISVLSATGDKLSYLNALKRSGLVFIQGLCLGIPIAILITMLFGYRRLARTGTTLWDTSAGSSVIHKKWSIIRVGAIVLYHLVLSMFLREVGFWEFYGITI